MCFSKKRFTSFSVLRDRGPGSTLVSNDSGSAEQELQLLLVIHLWFAILLILAIPVVGIFARYWSCHPEQHFSVWNKSQPCRPTSLNLASNRKLLETSLAPSGDLELILVVFPEQTSLSGDSTPPPRSVPN